MTMRAWRVHRYGEPVDALRLDDVDEPEPGPGQVLVHTAATPLNFNEVDGCFGRYRTVDPPLPYTLGMEVVGEVVAAGEGTDAWLGRRVTATAAGAFGAHAEAVGGETSVRTFPCVAHGARYVLAGFSGGIEAEDSGLVPRPLLFGNFDLCGVMLSYRNDPAAVKRVSGFNLFSRADGERVQTHLVDLLDAGKIRTVVGRTAPCTDLPAELTRLANRATVGRTVLDWRA